MRRWKLRYEKHGYDGILDRRHRKPSVKRVALETVKEVLALYRERYYDCNVLHFHEKLTTEHGETLSYSWVKNTLQTAGLVPKGRRRSVHRKARPRRPMRGMLLHTDASTHAWLPGQEGKQDLIAVMDDATNEVYYACLVDQESTLTMLEALYQVVVAQGVFCALYVDKASHFVITRHGQPPHYLDHHPTEPTQIGRALHELGIDLIPANSPQARGRMERLWKTWQGRLPQELRLAGISTPKEANAFIQNRFIPEHNRLFSVEAKESGSAFVPYVGNQLDRIFSIVHSRVVGNDNCVSFKTHRLQIPQSKLRYSYAKCHVKIYEHLDGTLSIGHGPHTLGCYDPKGVLLDQEGIPKEKRRVPAPSQLNHENRNILLT